MTTRTIGFGLLMLSAMALAFAGCGRAVEDIGPVAAINLDTGETKTFGSKSTVPPGWAPCSDPTCGTFPSVPCQNLGKNVCTKNPNCRLKKLWCSGASCVEPGGTPGGSGGSTPPDNGGADTPPGDGSNPPSPGCPPPTPPKCEYACIPKLPLECNEVKDATKCSTRTDCEWGPAVCPAMACAPGHPCPPCLPTCQKKAPSKCEDLGQAQCGQRADCSWNPQPCPMMCAQGAPGCTCPSFCRAKKPDGCPSIPSPPPGYCADGTLTPRYDAKKCVIGFDCKKTCPAIPMMYPECKDGKVEPTYSADGCLTGYKCVKTVTPCDKLAKEYSATVIKAKSCNSKSMLAVMQCTVSVPNRLACACTTYINDLNQTAVATLKKLKAQWDAQKCGLGMACPAVACLAPQGAKCAAGQNGAPDSCIDNRP